MKYFIFFLGFISSITAGRVFGQCLDLGVGAFTNACSSILPYPSGVGCPTWTDACGSGWTRSHGAPQLIPVKIAGTDGASYSYYAWMESSVSINDQTDTGSAGMFTPYSFQQGTYYDVKYVFSTNLGSDPEPSNLQSDGYVHCYAANGLTEHAYDACMDQVPNAKTAHIQTQMIGNYDGLTPAPPKPGLASYVSYTFQANGNYSQFWIFPYATTSLYKYQLNLYNVEICPSCTAFAQYPEGTLPARVAGGMVNIGGGPGGSTVTILPNATTTITAGNFINFAKGFSASASNGARMTANIVPCGTSGASLSAADAYDSVVIDSTSGPVFVDAFKNSAQTGEVTKFNSSEPSNSKLLIYPTVSSGAFTLTGALNELGNATIMVFDQAGQSVYATYNEANTAIQLDLGRLSNGLYFVQIRQPTKTTNLKIIIQK